MKLSEALRKGSAGRKQIHGGMFQVGDEPQFSYLPRLDDLRIDRAALPQITGCCALGAIALACAAEWTEPIDSDYPDQTGLGESRLIIAATGVNIRSGYNIPGWMGSTRGILELCLARMNDAGLTFEEIAKTLEDAGL